MSEQRPPTFTRRQLLAGFGLTALAVTPGTLQLLRATPADTAEQLAARLVGLLQRPDRLHALGVNYLAQRPHQPTERHLVDELLSPVLTRNQVENLPDNDLRQALTDWIEEDFAAGRLEPVDGWLLSATEARLAGLVALRD